MQGACAVVCTQDFGSATKGVNSKCDTQVDISMLSSSYSVVDTFMMHLSALECIGGAFEASITMFGLNARAI